MATRVVLITGASSGFGQATALAFARKGDAVYASMREPGKGGMLAEQTAREKLPITILPLDVIDKPSIHSAVERIVDLEGRIDVLVNNAGVHLLGAIEDMPEPELRRVMETNFFGVLHVTRTVLPAMRRQRSGRIIMISSIGAMIGRAGDAVYCASKSALEGAAEGLRFEVAPFGISVSVIEPGAFRTGLVDKFERSKDYPPESPYRALIEFRLEKVIEACTHGDDPERVANLVVEVAGTNSPAFRYPAGAQAEDVLSRLKRMNEQQRHEFIRDAAKLDWWLSGRDRP